MRSNRVACLAFLLASLAIAHAAMPAIAAAPAQASIRVVDAAGRTVELPRPPERIVVIGRGPYMALDLLYLFPGASRRLVGMETRGGSGSEFLPLVDSSFARKTGFASPGPEQIATMRPDLVLMKANTAEATGASLAEVGVPIVYLGLETPEQFDRDVANLGTLLGQPARAQGIAAYYHTRLNRIRQGWTSVPEARRPRVLLAEYNERGGTAAVRVPARPWMQTLEVEAAGGRPVWLDSAAPTNGWTLTNLEQIARWDPDVIVLIVWRTLDPARVLATLGADPQWRALRAVRSGNLRAFPQDVYGWDTPDPRWLLGTIWMAKTLHPDRFRSLDLEREIHDFFATLYGMSDRAIADGVMSKVRLHVR